MSEEQQTTTQHNHIGTFDTGAFTAPAPKEDRPAAAGDSAAAENTTTADAGKKKEKRDGIDGIGDAIGEFFHDLGEAISPSDHKDAAPASNDAAPAARGESDSDDEEGINHKVKGFIQQVADDFSELLHSHDSKYQNHPKTSDKATDEPTFQEQLKPQAEPKEVKEEKDSDHEGINKKFIHFCDNLSDDIHKLVSSDDSKKKDDDATTTTTTTTTTTDAPAPAEDAKTE